MIPGNREPFYFPLTSRVKDSDDSPKFQCFQLRTIFFCQSISDRDVIINMYTIKLKFYTHMCVCVRRCSERFHILSYCSQLIQAFHTYLPIVKAHKLSLKTSSFQFQVVNFHLIPCHPLESWHDSQFQKIHRP